MTLFLVFSYKLPQPQTSFLQTSCNRLHGRWYSKTIVKAISGSIYDWRNYCNEYQVYINRFVFECNVIVSLRMAKIEIQNIKSVSWSSQNTKYRFHLSPRR